MSSLFTKKVVRRNPASGYSIPELMIVLAILGILGSVAVPQYNEYVLESRRGDAISSMNRILSQQELFFANNGSTYTVSAVALGYAYSPPEAVPPNDTAKSEDKFYWLEIETCDSGAGIRDCVKVTATPAPGSKQANDVDCATFVLNSKGRQTAATSGSVPNNEECWG